jgi:tetratricopeptide (TPR) repeat protein
MAKLRYKAYISYSHKDESWAKWLHRALEAYRLPRNLVDNSTLEGGVPPRIRPVFRDRDDLSSAIDLGSTVKQALADSENLIIICSPNAAVSHWVSEEIRQFAGLGRADRIFCIIVDGEPAADGSVAACFPTALKEIGLKEPLAADVRQWADGKHVALLKLVAGLLGLRLDELRQRDLQRRRKRQALTAVSILMAVTLAVTTVVSKVSERHEREKAEQLATFVVDLGERLQSDVDLETLALISTEAARHLQDLDPNKLSAETGKRVALALRQMGRVNQSQGKPDEALESFQRSLELLKSLNDKYPETSGLLFELGVAEFYIGNLHLRQASYEGALESFQNYHRITSKLVESDPGNPDWVMELSYSHNNLAALQLDSGKGINKEALFHVAEATRLMEAVVAMKPGDEAVADGYATILAWAATAQNLACNLEEAFKLRERVLALAESSTRADPANNDLKKRHAYAITGVAQAQILTGRLKLAEQNLRLAILMLQQLSAADPSNIHFSEETLVRQVDLAKLLAHTGQLEAAAALMKKVEAEFSPGIKFAEQTVMHQDDSIEFLLAYADIEFKLGNVQAANRYLLEIIDQQKKNSSGPMVRDIYEIQRLVKTRYQWWLINGNDKFDQLPVLQRFDQNTAVEFRSCFEADSAARMYMIEKDKDGAAREVAYLQSRGYADPDFISFCEKHDLCER